MVLSMEYMKFNISSPLQFTSGGQFESDYPWTHAKRIIDTYELLIGTKETLYMQQEDHLYELISGDIMLLEPYHLHEGYRECSSGISFDWLHFRCQHEVMLVDEETLIREITSIPPISDSAHSLENGFIYIPLFFSPSIMDRVNIQFRQLMHVANSPEYNAFATHYLLTTLLIEVSEQALQHVKRIHRGGKTDNQISKIMEWTRMHATEKLSAHDVAHHFNYNRDYLSRFFKINTGINLQEYIHRQKILKAKELLSRSDLTVQQISQEVGIPDEKYFMKLFKVYEGITPTEFRKAYYQTFINNE
jgi:AraC-like DNA-binding protein